MLALADARVVEVPQLGPLRARVPLAEVVAEGEDPLLRAAALLVAAGAADRRVEAVLLDRVEQRRRLQRLRDARGPVSSTTRPLSIDSCTDATTSRSPSSATRRSRYSIASGKLCPVSTCMIGNGNLPGRNAFSASRSRTIESLPPEKSSTGRSSSAATSRKMWTASDSSSSRCVTVGSARDVLTTRIPRARATRLSSSSRSITVAADSPGVRPIVSRRSSGSSGSSYGCGDAGEVLDLAGECGRVETLRIAPRALLERRRDVDLDERRVLLDERRARGGASPRTARSPRRSRPRRRARGARRPSRCARCSCRGPPSRSRDPWRGACGRRRRRGGRRRGRAARARGSTMFAIVVLPGAREAREPERRSRSCSLPRRGAGESVAGATVWMPHSTLRAGPAAVATLAPAASSACRRSSRSPGRGARCTAARARGCSAQQSSSVQSASGFAFQSSCFSSQPSFGASARVGDWSRRMPVIQQSRSSSARLSGSTFAIAR